VLQPGDTAPDIDAPASDGTRFSLAAQSTKLCTVLYFFPKAFTPGCTVETKLFRDNYAEIALAGATIVGVSTDKLDTQCRFASEMKTPFPLIADPTKKIAQGFGVLFPLVGIARRVTFVLNRERRVLAIFSGLFDVEKHRDGVLRFIHHERERMRARA
jgi:peroxiredoxin